MNRREKLVKLIDSEAIKYIFFGIATTVINLLSYLILSLIGMTYVLSNLIAFLLSIIFAFITNKLYVFNSKSWERDIVIKEGITFLGARGITFCGDMMLLIILIEVAGINDFIAKCIVNIVVIVLNYILSKLIVFKQKTR